jgi:hypothetical protein
VSTITVPVTNANRKLDEKLFVRTGDKLAAGVIDTSDQYFAGVIGTGHDKSPPISNVFLVEKRRIQ